MKHLLVGAIIAVTCFSLIHCSGKPRSLAQSLPALADDSLSNLIEAGNTGCETPKTRRYVPSPPSSKSISVELLDSSSSSKIVKNWVGLLSNSLGASPLGTKRNTVLLLATDIAKHLEENNHELWDKIEKGNTEQTTVDAFKAVITALYPRLR